MKLRSSENLKPIDIVVQEKGQLVVEYVLLLFIVVFIATALSKKLVGRHDGNGGVIINKWGQILETVGQDLGD